MKAAVLHTSPGDLVVEDLVVDNPAPDEVLIRTAAAGLCHSDLHYMRGLGHRLALPCVLGHESAGLVEAVGDAVTDIKAGDTVVTFPGGFCGHCNPCLSGRPTLCDGLISRRSPDQPRLTLGSVPVAQTVGLGSFAELMLVHQHQVAKIRPDVPLDAVALIGCAVLTGIGAVWRSAAVRPGSTVAVIGCSGVGLNVVQGAILAGARQVIAVDTNPAKLELATVFGATDVVDATAADPVEQVRELTRNGRVAGVDYSFEAVGLKATAEQSFAMLTKGGLATVLGVLPPNTTIELPALRLMHERKIQGSALGSSRCREDIGHYVDLYAGGRLKLDELISARIDLTQVNAGFEAMATANAVRSVIVF